MRTPTRILRADADDIERGPPGLTSREQEQYERILAVAETVMARHGAHTMTLGGLTLALRMSSGALRRYFSDLDGLLATVIGRHLQNIARALGEIPQDAPDRPQKLRAAYRAFTRTTGGDFIDAHLLLVRDRLLLPKGLLSSIEATRLELGELLCPGYGALTIDVLDMRSLGGPTVEAALAAIAAAEREPAPAPPDILTETGRHTIH